MEREQEALGPDGTAHQSIRTQLLDWARFVLAAQGLQPSEHHLLMIAKLALVASGTIDRLMLLMPPGAAKSTYASVLFPVWWFTRHPKSTIVAAAHTARLAAHFGRRARNLAAEYSAQLGYRLVRDERAAAGWSTDQGGSYYATGIGGTLIGRRADLVLVDDPVKSQRQAYSFAAREHIWDWFRSDLASRLKPGGRIVLIMTRWHQDDLGGRLLAEQLAGGDTWDCLRLPALAEEEDPLGRPRGAPLWPEWEDAAALARKRATVGERVWAALYQQSPRPLEGLLFKTQAIATIAGLPESDDTNVVVGRPAVVRAWDLAATSEAERNDPDWTVGLRLRRDASGRFVVEDIIRFRSDPDQMEATILATARADGRCVSIAIPQDPGQAGKYQARQLVRQLAGYHIIATRESGSKVTRALPVASQVAATNLVILDAPWNRAFLEELRDFPYGSKDDQVDALARAFAHLVEAPPSSRRIMLPLMQR
ncbi:MAG: phage terminase large subunit [Alphaproteobacteria bacterium]|nr:phage terminase large subunit [Alphaproteobacteria bacterium]